MNKEALQAPLELLLVGGAVEAGIFEALRQRAMDAAELAGILKADRRAVWTVAEALVSLGYLGRQEGGRYCLSAGAEEMFYRPESEDYTGFAFMHGYELIKSWLKLPEVIRSGRPAKKERSPRAAVISWRPWTGEPGRERRPWPNSAWPVCPPGRGSWTWGAGR
ncbi:MAG: hypothetical protein AB1523_10150 [Bacillota bacterium]